MASEIEPRAPYHIATFPAHYQIILRLNLTKLLRLDSNLQSSCLSLPSSWQHSHTIPIKTLFVFLLKCSFSFLSLLLACCLSLTQTLNVWEDAALMLFPPRVFAV